jgi:hypothetical protein
MLDHHTVNVALERPPHNLIFLNALLSRIYAFLPRPADMLTTLLRAPIAEFRRVHREAVTATGAALVRFAKSCGLIRGEWIAIDGSKFRAVASIDTVRERIALQRYLGSLDVHLQKSC